MAVFILEDALCVWTNLGKHSLFVWLFVSSVKTGTRRIIRPDELSFVVRLERRINHKEKKLTVSRNETKILTVNRKRHNPIETLSVMKQKHDLQVCIVDRARHRQKIGEDQDSRKTKTSAMVAKKLLADY